MSILAILPLLVGLADYRRESIIGIERGPVIFIEAPSTRQEIHCCKRFLLQERSGPSHLFIPKLSDEHLHLVILPTSEWDVHAELERLSVVL